jgi:hypothetical protein
MNRFAILVLAALPLAVTAPARADDERRVEIYDVSDLVPAIEGPSDMPIEAWARKICPRARIERKGGVLVVAAIPEGHAKLRDALAELRAKTRPPRAPAAPKAPRLPGAPVPPAPPATPKASLAELERHIEELREEGRNEEADAALRHLEAMRAFHESHDTMVAVSKMRLDAQRIALLSRAEELRAEMQAAKAAEDAERLEKATKALHELEMQLVKLEGGGEPRPGKRPANVDSLRAEVERLEAAVRELRAEGRLDEVAKLHAVLAERLAQIEATKERLRGRLWEAIPKPHGEGGEAAERLRHLREASRNLRAAGDLEQAEKLEAQVAALEKEMAARAHASREGDGPRGDVLKAVQGLTEEVRALRAEVKALRELVERQSAR